MDVSTISNHKLGVVKGDHPIYPIADKIRMCLGSDDPAVFDCTVYDEINKARDSGVNIERIRWLTNKVHNRYKDAYNK